MFARYSFITVAGLCAVAALLTIGCSEEDNPSGIDIGSAGTLFVVESDFQSGQLEGIDIETNTMTPLRLSVYRDAVVKVYGGYVYILERQGADNIMKFDPAAGDESGVVYQTHLGDNWNPVDVEFVSESKAYISNQDVPKISVFDPSAGAVTGNIDISNYIVNPDSNVSPYANEMVLAEGNLYVMLQRRDGFEPAAATLILTISTETDSIIVADTIACTYKNGYDMVYVDGALYVTNQGSLFATGDGAVEKIDLATRTVSTIVDETALGGNPNQIVHKEGTRFYVQNYIGWGQVSVVEIDAATNEVVATLAGVKNAFGGICYDAGTEKLFVGERDSAAVGVRVYEDNVEVAGSIKSEYSLPPISLAVVR